jgi:hypothetical protein
MNTTVRTIRPDLNRLAATSPDNEAVPVSVNQKLDRIKHAVFDQYQPVLASNEPLLRLALVEADALARQTEYPHLIFPVLAEEKALNAARWQFRQHFLLRTNETLAA